MRRILAGSVIGHGALLDFGIRPAVIKYVAEHRARGDIDRLRSVIATVLVVILGSLIEGHSSEKISRRTMRFQATLKTFFCGWALAMSVVTVTLEGATAPQGTALSGLLPSAPSALTIVPDREFAADSYVHKPLARNAPAPSPSQSTKFKIHDRVQVQSLDASDPSYRPVNVHETPNGTLTDPQQTGLMGTVTGGPVSAGGFTWWHIDVDTGYDGWINADFLVKYTAPPPPPPPKFQLNDRVQVHRGRESFQVHETPNGKVLGNQPNVSVGTVIEGPVFGGSGLGNGWWWKIDFDSGPLGAGLSGSTPTPFDPALDGWVDDEFVVKYTPPPLPGTPQSITIQPGRDFAADSYVHQPLGPNAPLHPKSAIWVADLIRQINHPNYYGIAGVNTHHHTPPIYIVGPDTPTVHIKAIWQKELGPVEPDWHAVIQNDFLAVPLPADFYPALGDDLEAVVCQPSTGQYWEFIGLRKTGARVRNSAGVEVEEWGTYWGGKIDNLATNSGYYEPRPDGTLAGRQATGLPDLAGILTIEEQRAGIVNHALHLAIPEASSQYFVYPAQRTDGAFARRDAIPEGALFQLPANLNLDAIDMDPYARMLAKAVQKYGLYISDTGGAVVFRAENPAGRYAVDPYYGEGGIMRCPENYTADNAPQECWPAGTVKGGIGRLRGFPWNKLQALKPKLMK
jgi:hypothetical protein